MTPVSLTDLLDPEYAPTWNDLMWLRVQGLPDASLAHIAAHGAVRKVRFRRGGSFVLDEKGRRAVLLPTACDNPDVVAFNTKGDFGTYMGAAALMGNLGGSMPAIRLSVLDGLRSGMSGAVVLRRDSAWVYLGWFSAVTVSSRDDAAAVREILQPPPSQTRVLVSREGRVP